MNNLDKNVSQKENEQSSENKLKDMEIYDLNVREFKIVGLKIQDMRKLRQLNELRNKIKQKDQFTK